MSLQYGIKEVLDILMRDYATGKPITLIDYALGTSNEVAAENVPLTGGRSNALIMSFDHSKTSTMTLTLPIVDLALLALLGGSELENATKELLKTEKLTVRGGKVTLAKEPVGDVKTFKVDAGFGFGEEISDATATDKEITFTGQEDGSEVYVIYQYAVPQGSKKVSISSNKFPKAVSMTGYGLARDRETEQDMPVQVDVPKARPQSNFTFNMSGTEITNLELTFQVQEFTDENGRKGYIDYTFINEQDDVTP